MSTPIPKSIRQPAFLVPVVAAFIGSSVFAADAAAQTRSLTWTETTQLEVPGFLGTVLRLTGATQPTESTHALHIQGRALIQEDGSSAFVLDLEGNRWISVDHESRTYITLTFADMESLSREAMDALYMAAADVDADAMRAERERQLEETRATLAVRVNSEATGDRRDFGSGISARRHIITTEFEAIEVPDGVDEPEGGTMLFLTELWQSTDVPSADDLHEAWGREVAADPRFRAMAEEMAESGEAAANAMAGALAAWSPEIAAGLMAMGEAIERLEGSTVRSVTTIALVPPGTAWERDELLAWEPETMGGQLRGAAGGAARQAATDAVDAARGALRGLGGRFGRGGGDPEPEPEPEPDAAAAPAPHPLFRVIVSRENVAYRESGENVLGALEARIADYRTQTIEDLTAQP